MAADLSQLFPWMLAIFTVLGLIACCAWFYKCLKKCNDRCSLLRPQHAIPHGSSRPDPHDFYQVGAFRARPGPSIHMTSTSLSTPLVTSMRENYSYRGPFALKTHYHPYTHLPPPPSYDEAMAAPTASSSHTRAELQHETQQEIAAVGLQERDANGANRDGGSDDIGRQDDTVQLTDQSSSHTEMSRENS